MRFVLAATWVPMTGGPLPKKGTRTGILLWCVLDADELRQLDAIVKGHNTILGRLKRRGKKVARTQFVGNLVFDALVEKLWPSLHDTRPGEVRVRLRLPFGAADELESWVRAENERRVRRGDDAVPRQQVVGGLVRRFLAAEARQQTEPAPAPQPVPVPEKVLRVAGPFLAERQRYWEAWNRMLAEEQARRAEGQLWETMYDDEWAQFFARHDVIRDVVGTFTVPRGKNPNVLQRMGLVAWLTPRLRVAGFRRGLW